MTSTMVDTTYGPPAVPEALIDDTKRYAGVGERIGATLIDCLISMVLCIPAFRAEAESRAATFAWMAVVWAIWYAYSLIAYRRWGQTLGKWILRIRLVAAADFGLASSRQILARVNVFAAIALLILPGYWIALGRFHAGNYGDMGISRRQTVIEELTPAWADVMWGSYWLFLAACVVSILVSSRKQSLHDLVAGTVVLSLRAREPVTYAAPVSRGVRALRVVDWTLATLLALASAFFLLAVLGANLDTNPATAANLRSAVKPMLYFAGTTAVLAALMVNAALSLRSQSMLRARRAHLLAYLLTFLPIGLLVFGFFLT